MKLCAETKSAPNFCWNEVRRTLVKTASDRRCWEPASRTTRGDGSGNSQPFRRFVASRGARARQGQRVGAIRQLLRVFGVRQQHIVEFVLSPILHEDFTGVAAWRARILSVCLGVASPKE